MNSLLKNTSLVALTAFNFILPTSVAEENAGSATISVTGAITQTNSCQFSGLSAGNVSLDVGTWLVSGLDPDGGLMKSKKIDISVNCSKATPFFMRFSSAATPTTDTSRMGVFKAGSSNKDMAYLTLQAVGAPEAGNSTANLSPVRWSYNGNASLGSITTSTVGTPVTNPVVNAMDGDLRNGLIILQAGSSTVTTERSYKFTVEAAMHNTKVSDWSSSLTGTQNLNATMTMTFYTL